MASRLIPASSLLASLSLGLASACGVDATPDPDRADAKSDDPGQVADPAPDPGEGTFSASPGFFDAVLDTERHQLFLSYGGDRRVEVVNLYDGSIVEVATEHFAESMYFDEVRSEVVIALPVRAHSSYWWDEEQTGYVGAIDAESLMPDEPIEIALDPWQLAGDGKGHAYVTGASGQWTQLAAVDLDAGTSTLSDGPRHRSALRIHPQKDRVYLADVDLSPSDIERYTVDGGTVSDRYDSPYHGDYPMCGDLRLHPGGDTIYTACGHVFLASNTRTEDMTWLGTLDRSWLDLGFSSDGDAAFMLGRDDADPWGEAGDPVELSFVDPASLTVVDAVAIEPTRRLLVGSSYVVLLGDTGGGAPKTRVTVLPVAPR